MKISPIAQGPQTVHSVIRNMDGQRLCIALVAETPVFMEKYSSILIEELDNLFHIVVNPPEALTVPDVDTNEPTALCTLDLKDQWEHVKRLYKNNPFNLVDLYKWFDEVVIIPERTAIGNIHMHYLARLNKARLASDIPKLFWRMFNINCVNPSNASALKRFKNITSYMVNVEPVKDAGIIQYLFHKDKKDYESIMHLKVCGEYRFKPLYMLLTKYSDSSDSSSDSD